MNTNNNFTYQGLLNRNIGSSATCDNMNATTITVTNLTVTHLLGILCQVSNTAIGNPEITFSFDPITNTFTIYLNNSSIPLSRLDPAIYASNATPSTLVFRDATNSSTMNNLTISNLFTATVNSLSCVSRSNLIQCTSVGAGIYPIMLAGNLTGYINAYADNSNSLTYSRSTLTLSSHNGIFTGLLTATANTLSCVSRSNQVYCAGDNGNHENPLLFFQNTG